MNRPDRVWEQVWVVFITVLFTAVLTANLSHPEGTFSGVLVGAGGLVLSIVGWAVEMFRGSEE